jgi:L-rhamnose mutarotase
MRRIAQAIRVRPEKIAEYRELHRAVPPAVLERLRSSRIADYSIHLLGETLFSYFEYHGEDLAADLAAIAEDEASREWWRLTDPCQEPVPEAEPGAWWTSMEEVFFME